MKKQATTITTFIYQLYFAGNLGKPQLEKETILDFNVARDDGMAVAADGPYANHLHHSTDS